MNIIINILSITAIVILTVRLMIVGRLTDAQAKLIDVHKEYKSQPHIILGDQPELTLWAHDGMVRIDKAERVMFANINNNLFYNPLATITETGFVNCGWIKPSQSTRRNADRRIDYTRIYTQNTTIEGDNNGRTVQESDMGQPLREDG